LIERQRVPHLNAFGIVCDIHLEGKDVRRKGEQMVRCGLIDEEVVLHTLAYLCILGRDIRIHVQGILQLVERLSISSDS
jgi:hypothetical protein